MSSWNSRIKYNLAVRNWWEIYIQFFLPKKCLHKIRCYEDEQLRLLSTGIMDQPQLKVVVPKVKKCLWPTSSDCCQLVEEKKFNLEPAFSEYHLSGHKDYTGKLCNILNKYSYFRSTSHSKTFLICNNYKGLDIISRHIEIITQDLWGPWLTSSTCLIITIWRPCLTACL